MDTPNQSKVKLTCFRISMLMEHQHILPDLKELALEIFPENTSSRVDYNSDEYLAGANDALFHLIKFLEQKSF